MNLKEAFRYQNYLESMLVRTELYLGNSLHTIEVKQTHLRSKVDPLAEDEVFTSEQLFPQRSQHFDINKVVAFMLAVMNEKRLLSIEINNAKRFTSFQLDHELACNKVLQRVAKRIGNLAQIRPQSKTTSGTGRRFNAEGNQILYTYDVVEEQMVAFDRDEMRRMSKEMLADADEVSNRAECFMLETTIMFEPVFSVNDSFEESVEAFIKRTSSEDPVD